MTAVARLKTLLAEKDKIIVCPGIYDGFTARIALQIGFECFYMVCSRPSVLVLLQIDLTEVSETDWSRNYNVKARHG
jgi:2-methylisocitrate lyase-like PEP mutase family enzyme